MRRAAVVVRVRRKRGLARLLRVRVLGSALLGGILIWLAVAWGVAAYGERSLDVDEPYDAIIVCGARVYASGRPSTALVERVKVAAALYEQGAAPIVVTTGGAAESSLSEAEAAASTAVLLGVPQDAIVIEARSTSTEENARFAAEQVSARRVLVVTDGYHVFRAERVFGRYFEQVRGVGSHNPYRWPRVRGAVREVAALVGYGVLGRL